MATPDLLTTRTHAVIGVIHGYPVSVLWIILAGGLADFGASCHRPVPHLSARRQKQWLATRGSKGLPRGPRSKAKSHAPTGRSNIKHPSSRKPDWRPLFASCLSRRRGCGKQGVAEAKTRRTELAAGFLGRPEIGPLGRQSGTISRFQPTVAAAAAGRMDAGADSACRCRLQEPLISCAERVSQAFPGKHRTNRRAKRSNGGEKKALATLFSGSPASLARFTGTDLPSLGMGAGRARGASGKRRAWPHGGTPAGSHPAPLSHRLPGR